MSPFPRFERVIVDLRYVRHISPLCTYSPLNQKKIKENKSLISVNWMNFRGINSIFHSQALKLESFLLALKLFRKENQLQHHPTHHRGECQNLDSEKKRSSFYVRRISPLPKLLTTKNSKKGAYTPEYTVLCSVLVTLILSLK